MNLIIWLATGGVIGWLASVMMKTDAQMGLISNVIVGIAGAALGSWLASVIGLTGGPVMGFVGAVLGAVILIAILRATRILK